MNIDERRKQMKLERIAKKRAEKRRRRFRIRITAIMTIAAMTVFFAGFTYVASAKEVTITEINEFSGTNESVIIKTRANKVGEVLAETGVVIGDSDKLNIPEDAEIGNESEIVIMRGKQITIMAGGTSEVVNVTKADTASALAEAGYTPGKRDTVVANGADLSEADTIMINSVEDAEEVRTDEIEFDTEYIDDSDMMKGETRLISEGKKGCLTTVQRVSSRDGVELSRVNVSREITVKPVNRVVARGTKEAAIQTPAETPAAKGDTGTTINGMKYRKKITMQATAYSTSPSENGGYSVSAMGNPLKRGIVAIDPDVVPLGSKVYVESTDGSWVYGVASAEDTGGAIRGSKIDLCYEGSASSVNKFGRRSCNVYILEN